MYNPELLHKPRILGVSKKDLIDDELQSMIEDDLPEGISTVFFSAVSQDGITELKDLIWEVVS